MTHTLTNQVTAGAGNMVVTCDPLQAREESLNRRQMGETLGGSVWVKILKAAVDIFKNVVAGVTVAELTSNDKSKPQNRQGCCSCTCRQ